MSERRPFSDMNFPTGDLNRYSAKDIATNTEAFKEEDTELFLELARFLRHPKRYSVDWQYGKPGKLRGIKVTDLKKVEAVFDIADPKLLQSIQSLREMEVNFADVQQVMAGLARIDRKRYQSKSLPQ